MCDDKEIIVKMYHQLLQQYIKKLSSYESDPVNELIGLDYTRFTYKTLLLRLHYLSSQTLKALDIIDRKQGIYM